MTVFTINIKSVALSSAISFPYQFSTTSHLLIFNKDHDLLSSAARIRGVINLWDGAREIGKETKHWTKELNYTHRGTWCSCFIPTCFVCALVGANKSFMKSLITDPIYHSVYVNFPLFICHVTCDTSQVQSKRTRDVKMKSMKGCATIVTEKENCSISKWARCKKHCRWRLKNLVSMSPIGISSFPIFFHFLGGGCCKYR